MLRKVCVKGLGEQGGESSKASIFDIATNRNFISVEFEPVGNGDGDLEAMLAKTYLMAKRKIPKSEDF